MGKDNKTEKNEEQNRNEGKRMRRNNERIKKKGE